MKNMFYNIFYPSINMWPALEIGKHQQKAEIDMDLARTHERWVFAHEQPTYMRPRISISFVKSLPGLFKAGFQVTQIVFSLPPWYRPCADWSWKNPRWIYIKNLEQTPERFDTHAPDTKHINPSQNLGFIGLCVRELGAHKRAYFHLHEAACELASFGKESMLMCVFYRRKKTSQTYWLLSFAIYFI